ncbi:hypothetical protein PSPO01_04789 [Paraphaeosphaeria sporulosa]
MQRNASSRREQWKAMIRPCITQTCSCKPLALSCRVLVLGGLSRRTAPGPKTLRVAIPVLITQGIRFEAEDGEAVMTACGISQTGSPRGRSEISRSSTIHWRQPRGPPSPGTPCAVTVSVGNQLGQCKGRECGRHSRRGKPVERRRQPWRVLRLSTGSTLAARATAATYTYLRHTTT